MHVPVGSSTDDIAPQEHLTDIEIKYCQFDREQCIHKGMASCLHFCGLVIEENHVSNHAGLVEGQVQTMHWTHL